MDLMDLMLDLDFLNYLMPDSNIPVSLELYVDHALLLSGSTYTVGIAEEKHDTSSKPAQLM